MTATLRIIFTGPADKLVVNGQSFKDQYVRYPDAKSMALAYPGCISVGDDDISVPGILTRDIMFDSEINAAAYWQFINTLSVNQKSAFFLNHAEFVAYMGQHGISITSQILST